VHGANSNRQRIDRGSADELLSFVGICEQARRDFTFHIPFPVAHSSEFRLDGDVLRMRTREAIQKSAPFILRLSDGMRRPVSTGCDTLPIIDVLEAQEKGDQL